MYAIHSIHTMKASVNKSKQILNPLFLYFYKAYSHQNLQGGDLLWEGSARKVTQAL